MSNTTATRIPTIAELVANVRRNLRHMKEDIQLDTRNTRLLDYVEHVDSLMQEIGRELDNTDL